MCDLADPPMIWSEGAARVLDYGGDGPSVLFVPSLVNRAYILDLMPGQSMMRWFAGRGVRPLLLDWGWPGAAERDFTPRCHPDAAAIPKRGSVGTGLRPVLAGQSPAATQSSWRRNISFKAMGWGLKESCDPLQLLAGDRIDIAYSLGMNDHPEFGGLELTVLDLAGIRRP